MIRGRSCKIAIVLLKKAGICICYTSNERGYFSQSTDVFNYVNNYESSTWYLKK